METWIMRRMGSAFDPEKHCRYSGERLWQFPIESAGPGWMIGYFRESDRRLMRVRDLTPEEAQWIANNPGQYAAELAELKAWLRSAPDDTRSQ